MRTEQGYEAAASYVKAAGAAQVRAPQLRRALRGGRLPPLLVSYEQR
ncbi:hypothetical protein [Streptomyces sp. NPDC056512]